MMINKFLMNKFLILALLVTSVLTPAAYPQQQTASATSAQVQHDAEDQKQIATEPFIRTELFFGADKPDGTEVSEEDFQDFLDKKVTPLFPDGLTVLSGKGQFCCDAARPACSGKKLCPGPALPAGNEGKAAAERSSRSVRITRLSFNNSLSCVWMIPGPCGSRFRHVRS